MTLMVLRTRSICKNSRVQTVTVMNMCVTAVVIVGDCIISRNFVRTAILLSTYEIVFKNICYAGINIFNNSPLSFDSLQE